MPPTLPHINRSAKRPVWLTESVDETCANTEHRSNYISHSLPSIPTASNLPNIHTSSDWPFNSNSEQRDKYLNHGAVLTRHRTRKGELSIPNVPLQKETLYRTEFTQLQQEKTKSFKPEREANPFGDLTQSPKVSNSLYREDFQRWKISLNNLQPDYKPMTPPRITEPVTFVEADHERPTNKEATLNGVTEVSNNYKHWNQTRQYYPPPKWKQSKVPFHKETSYKNEYITHHEPPIKLCKPTKSSLAVEDGTFDGVTTYKADFIRKPVQNPPRDVFVNTSSLMQSCGPTNWMQTGAPSQPFVEYTGQVFYHT